MLRLMPFVEFPLPARAVHTAQAAVRARVLLVAFTCVAHSGALFDGVRHDDWQHRATLRDAAWTPASLVEATTFALPGRQMHAWWQREPIEWRYPRPVAMALLKLQMELTAYDPVGLHACSIAWHALNVVLLHVLATRIGLSVGAAAAAAAVFAIQPNSVLTVSWTAAFNVLASTAFVFGALLAYDSASRSEAALRPRVHVGWAAAALAAWLAALFTRESAIVFPVLAAALDAARSGVGAAMRRWRVHALFAAAAAAFAFWRLQVFGVGSMPSGYLTMPDGAGYALWAAAKLVQAAAALVLQLPLIAAADYLPLSAGANVWLTLLAGLVVAGVVGNYAIRTRGAPNRGFGPILCVATLLPAVPVASSPHFAYLPAAGYALSLAALASTMGCRWRWAAAGTLAVVATMFVVQRFAHRGCNRGEQLVIADIASASPPMSDGAELYLANLPLQASFTAYAVREHWGLESLDASALTLADQVERVDRPTQVEFLDPHTLRLTAPPPGFFSSIGERWFLGVCGHAPEFRAGDIYAGPDFDTTIVTADARGVTELRFRFHEPIERENRRLFVGSHERPMARVSAPSGGVGPAEYPAVARHESGRRPAPDDLPREHRTMFAERELVPALWRRAASAVDGLRTGP